jgi:diguanylate cyclase (GGDEF)-like protein
MNYAFVPDLLALAILIVILLLLHQRHPQERVGLWLLGLFITLVEATAHTFYAQNGPPARFLHVIVLDGYLLAGLVFVWASGEYDLMQKTRLVYLLLNGLPLLAINTLYGSHVSASKAYLPFIASGLLIGAISSLYLRKSLKLAGLHVAGWLFMAYLFHGADYRGAVYWSLCAVYSIAAINFQRRLPAKSTGKLAIVTGFAIWTLCLLLHPWIVQYRAYADIASHVWNMQKSLISIGMILVMLEEQVSSNEWLALHDDLTGLPNRRLFADRMSSALQRAYRMNSQLAVVVVDLNGFKKINDTMGHHAGDQVLREVGANLRKSVRASDTLARLGGDEFIIVATDFAQGQCIDHFLEAIQDAIEEPLLIDGHPMIVTASLGFALYPRDGEDSIRLLKIADQRMYARKRKQRVLAAGPEATVDLAATSVG